MFNEKDPEAGTTDADLDVTENGGTPDGADGSEAGEDDGLTAEELRAKLKSERALALAHKAKAERVNALEAENAALKARSEQRTTTDNRGPEGDEQRDLAARQHQLAEDKRYLSMVEKAAEGGNEEARAALATVRTAVRASEQALAAEERTIYRLEMADVPKDERDDVRALMKEQGIRSPAIAHRFLRGGQFESLAEENARLKKELEQRKQPPPPADRRVMGDGAVVASSKRRDGVEEITLAEYNRRMRDPARWKETKDARDGKKLTIKYA